jgi:hypothetical protein
MTMMMSKGEREELQRLVRQREKAFKSAAKQRSAELIADFKNQMGQEYSFDQDEVWEKAVKAVEREIAKAQAQIAARCQELGIPARFAPTVGMSWHHRGYDNSVDRRKAELLAMAKARIEAIEAKAIVEIEMASVKAATEIASAGLSSDAARAFVAALPTVESLMPALSYAAVAGEAEPPIAEQLVSSNALRQRRYRERQAALHNGDVTPAQIKQGAAGDEETAP